MRDVMAKQTRIERQDKAKIESVSIDRFAADAFQLYVQGVGHKVWGGASVDGDGMSVQYQPPLRNGK